MTDWIVVGCVVAGCVCWFLFVWVLYRKPKPPKVMETRVSMDCPTAVSISKYPTARLDTDVTTVSTYVPFVPGKPSARFR